MAHWIMKEADHIVDAKNITKNNEKSIILDNTNGCANAIYVFQKECYGIIVYEYDCGIKPTVIDFCDHILVGTSSALYFFDCSLREIGKIPLISPAYEFLCSEKHKLAIALCEIDLYCLDAECHIIWHKPLDDILCDYRLEEDELTYSLFEGQTLSISIRTGQTIRSL